MYSPELTTDIKCFIANYIRPERFTSEGVKRCARVVICLHGNKEKLQSLKRIYDLVLEYSKYNHHAEDPEKFWIRTRLSPKTPFSQSLSSFLHGSPQLFTALSTGHWLFDRDHKHNLYSEKLENDIKEIIENIPESLNFIFGDSNIHVCILTPLSIACLNDKIPFHMIEFLINSGASLNVPCKATKQMVPLNNHLGWGSMNSKRLEAILKIFAKFQL
jgi:hypothetical protein